jgi:fluoroquinolone transport system permease protein
MTRLTATLKLDITVQLRSKLYHIAIGLALLLGVVMRLFLPADLMPQLLPLFYLFAIGGTAYFFVAGMIIFEKGEHTLDALNVSPLRIDEYLISKAISLLIVVLAESIIVLLISYGIQGLNPLLLLAGMCLMSLGLTLGGFIQVSRFNSVTDFLVPALVVTLILQLPWLHFAEIMPSVIWYLIPTTAPTLLLKAAFGPIAAWEMVYAVGYSLLTIGVLFWWARRAYVNQIILKGG